MIAMFTRTWTRENSQTCR